MGDWEVKKNVRMEREKTKLAKATCWDVVWGCMEDVVTCESSLDLDLDSDSDPDQGIGVKSKPYVVLRRPQSNSGPCQITIDFAQHHEIKQVYVRSSARVYEIYYAASTKAHNDYLCTVRCGPVLDAIPSQTHSTILANDDGWIDVKQTSLPMQIHNFQYLYEATAEVADADPVFSITLRLLSIQSGDYVRIDEIYVFTEPVVSADMDSTENSSGNTLMSMLIPTFMQLSKSRLSQIQERNDTCAGEIDENKSNSNALQSAMLNEASIDMSKLQKPDPISSPPVTGRETLSNHNHIERSLDELISRVANIEQLCLKFEEKLVKPISNMEARLVKIEQQLESFVSSQNSRTSESNYLCNDGIESHLTSTNMVQEPSITPSGSDTSLAPCYAPHLLPSLVVTAPDFSNIDDVDENDSAETVKKSSKNDTAETVKSSSNECPKKPPSLSDALASALAGFLSSASADSFKVEAAADCIQSPPSINVNEEAKRTTSVSGSPDKQEYDLEEEEEEDGNKKQADSYVIDKAIAEVGFVGSDDDINLYLDSPAPVGCGPSETESTSGCTKVTDDALHDILKLSSPAVLDFRTGVLDVEFSLQEDSFAKPPLEALLTDMPLFHDQAQSVKQVGENSSSGQNDLVFIGNEMEAATSEKNNEIWLPNSDFDFSNREHEVQNFHDSSHASLI